METQKIYGAICDIMGDIGSIGKDKSNTQQGYKFRGVDDVYNALQPVLVKHRVFPVPIIIEERREDRTSSKGNALIYTILKMKYRLYADDGSFVEAETIGEGMDSGDKSANKAMSVAYKYAMFQLLCIPTEAVDPDSETHEVARKVDLISTEQLAFLSSVYTGEALVSLLEKNKLKALSEMTYDRAVQVIAAYGAWKARKEAEAKKAAE